MAQREIGSMARTFLLLTTLSRSFSDWILRKLTVSGRWADHKEESRDVGFWQELIEVRNLERPRLMLEQDWIHALNESTLFGLHVNIWEEFCKKVPQEYVDALVLEELFQGNREFCGQILRVRVERFDWLVSEALYLLGEVVVSVGAKQHEFE